MRTSARRATVAAVAVLSTACSLAQGLPEAPSAVPTETTLAGAAVAVPSGTATTSGVGGVQAAPVELPATVTVVEPDFVVDASADLTADARAAIKAIPGLEHAAEVARRTMTLTSDGLEFEADVLVVDPEDFRPLTPEVTAQAVGVWERLAAGEVIVRHDVGAKLELELGGMLTLSTPDGSQPARIGAFAANGSPPVAEVLVPWSVASELGVREANGVVLGVSDDVEDETEDLLGEVLGEVQVERRRPPQTQTAQVTTGSSTLEAFSYIDHGDGTISIDPDWVARNIRTVEIPGIATTRCHRLMIPQLLAALDEIRAMGLYDHFKPEQFGGCWVARHIDWDPSKPLSNHSWGTAIDLNTHDNWLGDTPQMDRRIVAVFEKWGFEWGGHWRRPDGMHFELDRIVRPAEG